MRRFSFAPIVPLLVAVAACGSTPDSGTGAPRTSARSTPIYGGTPDTTHPSTVAVFGAQSLCTGTIVKVDGTTGYVLTAAHCIDDPPTEIVVGTNFDKPQSVFKVTKYQAHPKYTGNVGQGYDFAMVTFANAKSSLAVTPAMTKANDTLKVGDAMLFVGFGETDKNANNDIRYAVGGAVGKLSTLLISYNQAKGGPCQGDSGGPAFVTVGGVEYVAGVTSFGGDCWADGASGRVSAVQDFIEGYVGGTTGGGGAGGSGAGGSGAGGSTGASVCVGADAWTCDPVSTQPCGNAGSACDISDKGFGCFDQSTVPLGGACSEAKGPYCAAGATCSDAGVCVKICCVDADCGGGQACVATTQFGVTYGLCGPGGGAAGSGAGGSGAAGSGQAGSGQAGSGTAGSGTAGSGTAGSGTAGSGTAGSSSGGATAAGGSAGGGGVAGGTPKAAGAAGAAGDDAAPLEDGSSGSSGGCSISRAGGSPRLAWAGLALGALLLVRRKRARRA